MNEKNSNIKLIKLEETPNKDDFKSVGENQYIIANKKLWYFDCKTKELEEVSFLMQSLCNSLIEGLNVTEDRPALQKDLNSIKSLSGHTPYNAGFTKDERNEISKEFKKLYANYDYPEDSYFEYKKALTHDEAFKSSLQNIKDQFNGIDPFLFYQDYFLKKDIKKDFQPVFGNEEQYKPAKRIFRLMKFAKAEANAKGNPGANEKGNFLLNEGIEQYKKQLDNIFVNSKVIKEADVNKERDLNNEQQKDLMRISTEIKQIYGKPEKQNQVDNVKTLAENTQGILSKYGKGFAWRSSDRKEMFKNFKDELKKIEKEGFKDNTDKSNYQKMYEVLSKQKEIAVTQDSGKTGIHRSGSSRYINILNQAMDSLVRDWAKNAHESFGEYADLELAQFKTLLENTPKNLQEEAKAFHDALKTYINNPSKDNFEKIICPQDKEFKALPGNIRQFVTDVKSRLVGIKICHENKEEEKESLNHKI